MRCYFDATKSFEEIPLDKIRLEAGLGIHGLDYLKQVEKDALKFKFAWGAERRMVLGAEKIYLTSWCVTCNEGD